MEKPVELGLVLEGEMRRNSLKTKEIPWSPRNWQQRSDTLRKYMRNTGFKCVFDTCTNLKSVF